MNRAFPIAVVSSLTIHSLLFLYSPGASREPQPNVPKPLQLALAPRPAETLQPLPVTLPPVIREAERPMPTAPLPPTGADTRVNIGGRAERPPLPLIKPELPLPQSRPAKPAVPAFVDLSNLADDLGREPAYLRYFRSIRERIRYYAQQNARQVNRSGEVFVRFVLSSAGQLQSAELDAGRSVRDVALERLSLDSVRRAVPFPPFPSTFNQPQITFRIIIQYEAD